MELLQELHHQARRSAPRDKDINSERQVDAVHEKVAEKQGEAKSGKSRPSNHCSPKLILIEIFIYKYCIQW